jgi:hypothetical protein
MSFSLVQSRALVELVGPRQRVPARKAARRLTHVPTACKAPETMGPALLRVKGLISLLEHAQGSAVVRGAEQLLHGLAWMPAWPSDDRRTASVLHHAGARPSTRWTSCLTGCGGWHAEAAGTADQLGRAYARRQMVEHAVAQDGFRYHA